MKKKYFVQYRTVLVQIFRIYLEVCGFRKTVAVTGS
jgi:hypothetical protein